MKISSLKKFNLFVYCTILTFQISLQDIRLYENLKLLNREECGVSLVTSTILNNVEVIHGQFPWMARLGYINEAALFTFFCGGVLINENYVLSAAHCRFDQYRTLVRLGEVDLTVDHLLENTEWVQEIYIIQIFRHDEYYNIPPYKHDIALLRLFTPAIINTFVKPICLPFRRISSKDNLGEWLDVIGWGVTDLYGTLTPSLKLLHGIVPVVPLGYCTGFLHGDGQLCTGGVPGHGYTGPGDSGGPLMKYAFSKYYLIGLVSSGPDPLRGPGPTLYTDVFYYLDWILHRIQP